MNQGIYGLSGTSGTPVQGPFSGTADARKLLSVWTVVCGGGGGGSAGGSTRAGPGGGGGGALEITALGVFLQTSYTVSVGAGGAAGNNTGSASQFGQITAVGGGGAQTSSGPAYGATGSGSINIGRYPTVVPQQGFAGGQGVSGLTASGGGGGAGALGGDATAGVSSGSGGIGKASSITGAVYYYGGGGGGGLYNSATPNAAGGSGGLSGGGAGGSTGTAGLANSGGGGGGGQSSSGAGAAGGSGIVIIRWNASQAVATLSSGLTGRITTAGTDSVLTITAGTGTVTWN